MEMDKSDSAANLREKASALELTAGALMAIPNLLINMQPMGVSAAIEKLLQCTATALNLKGQMTRMKRSERLVREA